MPQLLAIPCAADLRQYDPQQEISPLGAGVFAKYPPDAHWMLTDGGQIFGRLSLWWTKTPSDQTHRVGVIGHYAVRDAETSHCLLDHACAELAARGCSLAVGPMDGNTMQRYRFLIERGDEPPFLLEPDNPDEWPEYWQAHGFTPLARYYSSLNEDLFYEDPRIPHAAARIAEAGVTIRSMRPDAFEDDMRRIYQVSAVSFQRNFMYVPFTEEEYLDLYLPFRSYVNPETVFIAEHDGNPVGFMFNIPNHLQAQRGEPIDTFMLKTFAVLPGRRYAGLGNVLVAHSHRIARELGYRRAIHALMYEGNNSLIISNRFSRPFRRYALFAKVLQP